MTPGFTSLYENKHLRTIVSILGGLAVLVLFTEMTLRTAVPLFCVFIALMMFDVADEMYDLPEGTNWLIYGASLFVAGTYIAVTNLTPLFGSLLALAGLWFVFDGVTMIRYDPPQTEHEYVSDLDDELGETMLRMQTLNVVYQALKNAPEPQTAEELATAVDLTESRVGSALGYLEDKGRIDRVGNQYRVDPPQWGRMTPVVEFLVWFPRRIVRPFQRITANA